MAIRVFMEGYRKRCRNILFTNIGKNYNNSKNKTERKSSIIINIIRSNKFQVGRVSLENLAPLYTDDIETAATMEISNKFHDNRVPLMYNDDDGSAGVWCACARVRFVMVDATM